MAEGKKRRSGKAKIEAVVEKHEWKMGKAEMARLADMRVQVDAMYCEIGKHEAAKIDLLNRISDTLSMQTKEIDGVFTKLGLDRTKSYDLDYATGVISESA